MQPSPSDLTLAELLTRFDVSVDSQQLSASYGWRTERDARFESALARLRAYPAVVTNAHISELRRRYTRAARLRDAGVRAHATLLVAEQLADAVMRSARQPFSADRPGTQTELLTHIRSGMTVVSNQEVRALAAQQDDRGRPSTWINVFDFKAELKNAALREGLGVRLGQTLDLVLVLDRSASTLIGDVGDDQVQLCQMIALLENGATRTSIVAYDTEPGPTVRPRVYDVKPLGDDSLGVMNVIQAIGGGGAPTLEAVTFAAERLVTSAADHKLILVASHGWANAPFGTTVDMLRDEAAIRVIGTSVPPVAGVERNISSMEEQFSDDWFAALSHSDVVPALLEYLGHT